MRKVLSFDVSSTCIGIALLEQNGQTIKLCHLRAYKPPKKGTLFERLSEVKKTIKSFIDEFKPDEIAIEDCLLFFNKFSTAKTIQMLTTFNRTVGLTCYEHTGKNPYLYSVATIRATLKRGKQKISKEEMPDRVAEILGIEWDWKLTKKGKKAPENFDQADGIAVGICHLLKTKEN